MVLGTSSRGCRQFGNAITLVSGGKKTSQLSNSDVTPLEGRAKAASDSRSSVIRFIALTCRFNEGTSNTPQTQSNGFSRLVLVFERLAVSVYECSCEQRPRETRFHDLSRTGRDGLPFVAR